MQLNTITLLFFSCLMIGCTQNSKKGKADKQMNGTSKEVKSTDFSDNMNVYNKRYDITFKGADRKRTVKAADIFKYIRYIPLETNNSSLLDDSPRNVFLKNNSIYVFDSRGPSEDELFLFNQDGKFLYRIGRKGQGAKEYLGGLHIAVSNKGIVSILNRIGSAIISYTTDNEFVSRIRMDSVAMYNGIYLNDSLLLVKNWHDNPNYKFHVVDIYKKKVVKSFGPVTKRRMYTLAYPEMFTRYRGKVLSSEFQSNEILELTGDTAMVRYIININDKMPPEGFWDQKVSTFSIIVDEEARKGYIGHIPSFAENDNSIFLYFRGSSSKDEYMGMAIIDKATGKHQSFKYLSLADNVIIKDRYFYPQNDGMVVFTVSPEDILNSGNQEFISQFPGLKEDDNLILMVAELK